MKKKDYSDLWCDVKLKDILKPDLLEKYKEAGVQTTGDLITYLMDAYNYHSRNVNWAKAHNRFCREFSIQYVDDDGTISWIRLLYGLPTEHYSIKLQTPVEMIVAKTNAKNTCIDVGLEVHGEFIPLSRVFYNPLNKKFVVYTCADEYCEISNYKKSLV